MLLGEGERVEGGDGLTHPFIDHVYYATDDSKDFGSSDGVNGDGRPNKIWTGSGGLESEGNIFPKVDGGADLGQSASKRWNLCHVKNGLFSSGSGVIYTGVGTVFSTAMYAKIESFMGVWSGVYNATINGQNYWTGMFIDSNLGGERNYGCCLVRKNIGTNYGLEWFIGSMAQSISDYRNKPNRELLRVGWNRWDSHANPIQALGVYSNGQSCDEDVGLDACVLYGNNSEPSLVGLDQHSPSIGLRGSGYGNGASRNVIWWLQGRNENGGGSNPTSRFTLSVDIAGGGVADCFGISESGDAVAVGEVRAGGDAGGEAGHVSMTDQYLAPSANTPVLGLLPVGFTTTAMSGWLKFYDGTTAFIVPAWKA